MTLSRDLSSSLSTSRFGPQPISVCTSQLSASRSVSTASPAILIVARIPSHDSNCAVSGILSLVFLGKKPFNTQ